MTVVSKRALSPNKYELAFGVEPAVKAGAARTGGYHYHEGIFWGVVLRWGVYIVECFSWVDIEVACVEGFDEEVDGKQEAIDPVAIVNWEHSGPQKGK